MLPVNITKLYGFADGATGTVDGVFGLIVGLMSGYIGASLGCKTQLALTNSMFLRHLVMYFVILMGVNSGASKALHPFNAMGKSFIVWAMTMMFNRMRPISTGLVVALFVILYMVKTLREYNQAHCEECDKKVAEGEVPPVDDLIAKAKMEDWDATLHNTQRGLMLGMLANVIVGSYLYLGDKKREYGPAFEWSKFVLGVQNCKSLS